MNHIKSKIKVAVGLSGGVDSSVAAKILKDQGYEVVGFMMKLWSEINTCQVRDNSCCDIEGLHDAKKIAAILDIPFYVVDVREKFKKEITDYFIEEYKALHTPNPCVKCNEKIKFGWLLDFAKSVGCDYLATGHYARIASDSEISNIKYQILNKNLNSKIQNNTDRHPELDSGSSLDSRLRSSSLSDEAQASESNDGNDNINNYHLFKGRDEKKDQSYFLYGLNQDQLKHVIFPVGGYTKEEVRAMAKKWNLPVHEKKESQEICFIQEKDYREFLKRHIPKDYFEEGDIVDLKGNIIGKHQGLINYTIGQRKNVNQELRHACRQAGIMNHEDKQALYVIGFDQKKNQLIVGEDKDVYKNEMIIKDVHFIQNQESRIKNHGELQVKIRYRHPAVKLSITNYQLSNNLLKVTFKEAQRAITPGQSAVFYLGDEVIGGGIIQ